jgi:hypothetical protein
MTQSAGEQNDITKIEAYLMLEDARIRTLPRHFGARMMTVENRVYHVMREFASEYKGGFYMAPHSDPVKFSVHSNGFENTLSADAAGITVCLFTFSHLSFQYPADEVFSRHFYALREFALDHKEAGLIISAID